MNDLTLETSCAQRRYEVHLSDLPVCCPMPDETLWDGHPRVYLDVQTNGEALCPYCSALYVLVD